MKLYRAALVALGLAVALGAAAQQRPTYTVRNARELVQRLGPNRTIILQKGDYQLWTAYEVTNNQYATWIEGSDGSELSLRKVDNLTIRGVEGSRIVGNSGSAYLLGLYESSKVEFENLALVRNVPEKTAVEAGSLYVESVNGLSLKRITLSGPSTRPLELWECSEVELSRPSFEGGLYGGIYAGYVSGLAVKGGVLASSEGYPLLYLEESESVTFTETVFRDNQGGNFYEAYNSAGAMETFQFLRCRFEGNAFEYFAGTEVFPLTEDCVFQDSSFDENWLDNSVAPSDESAYYGGEGDYEGPAYYIHYASGLAWSYPVEWELQEDAEGLRAVLISPYEEALAYFGKAYDLPAGLDPAKQSKKLFADALAAFQKSLAADAGLSFDLAAQGAASEEFGFLVQEYRGTATREDQSVAQAWLRLVVSREAVYAFLGLAGEESLFEPGNQLGDLLGSLELAPLGE